MSKICFDQCDVSVFDIYFTEFGAALTTVLPVLFKFTIWKSFVYNLFCRDGIYFDKILVSEYKLLRDRIRRIFYSPGPVACFSDEDDVSGNQNNCYWPLHNITLNFVYIPSMSWSTLFRSSTNSLSLSSFCLCKKGKCSCI
jgi:hypothetical protein